MSTIVVRDLSRRFGDFLAVDSVSFEVEKGEIFGYLGANGAGKSTTIKMLIGLLRPSSGEAHVAGFDIRHDLADVRRSIGYVSQKFSLYLDLTPRQNLEFFAGAYGLPRAEARRRITEQLEWTGLSLRETTVTGALPGGLRQRLALASAMLHQPDILFLDEPTAGVSPDARRMFWRAIRELSAAGRTIFVTTHHLDEAEYCNRVGLMVDGRLVALDTPRGLKTTHVPGAMFHITVPDVATSKLSDLLGGLQGFKAVQVYGLSVHARFDRVDRRKEIEATLAAHFPSFSVEEADASLEDVFLAVVASAATAADSAEEVA
jgi:ABC-2 type transport system ATP-binding protein